MNYLSRGDPERARLREGSVPAERRILRLEDQTGKNKAWHGSIGFIIIPGKGWNLRKGGQYGKKRKNLTKSREYRFEAPQEQKNLEIGEDRRWFGVDLNEEQKEEKIMHRYPNRVYLWKRSLLAEEMIFLINHTL